jgi:hypothetical protein
MLDAKVQLTTKLPVPLAEASLAVVTVQALDSGSESNASAHAKSAPSLRVRLESSHDLANIVTLQPSSKGFSCEVAVGHAQ